MNPLQFTFPTGRNYGKDQQLEITVPAPVEGEYSVDVMFHDEVRGIRGTVLIYVDPFDFQPEYKTEACASIGTAVLQAYDNGQYSLT